MIRLCILLFALGCAALQTRPELPPLAWAGALPLAWLAAWGLPWRRVRQAALLLAALASGFLYAAWRADLRLAETLPMQWEGRDIALTGRVLGLPDSRANGQRIELEVARRHTPGAQTPAKIQVSSYAPTGAELPLLHGGDCLRLTVRLHRPHGLINPGGFDFEAWLLERGIRASGTVIGAPAPADDCGGSLTAHIDRTRESLRARLRTALGERPYAGIVIALAIGDQNAIPSAQWTLFRQTGVSHLFSVSGLHITLFAALVLGAVRALWRRLPRLALRLPARRAGIALGLLAALAYTLISGYGIPAQRTLYMLAGAAAVAWLDRTAAPSRLLAAALLPVVLIDPWAALAPGFWLSFCAVAALLWSGMGRIGRLPVWREWIQAQWAVTLALTPLLLALFHEVSLVSPLANAAAIPVVSLIAVPLSLLGALSPWALPAQLAHGVLQAVMSGLTALAALPQPVFHAATPSLLALALAALGALLLLLPAGMPGRWMGVFLFLPLFFPRLPAPGEGEAWLTVLDVGQGQAVLVRTAHHTLVVDTGPGQPGGDGNDAGARIVAPYLWSRGINRLDGLIVSHDDIDHSGGAASLIASHRPGWVLSSIAGMPRAGLSATGQNLMRLRPDALACAAGQSWRWDGIEFSVLHPPAHHYALPGFPDNARSCTLRVQTPHGAALIPGDLERLGEMNLRERDALRPAEALIAGHHGSNGSSSPEFLAAVQPRVALISVGSRNRYGHPHPQALQRLRAIGAEVHRTDRAGALELKLGPGGAQVDTARATFRRYWHATPVELYPGLFISHL
ncbi:MAG: DNA internalization-related competence protein ComEC/Rec2 [Betaproteobacteria bacterium]|nr:DNA internalization-related competence protein ComEC/Rec2 [Betaproteobacteria bacterium]